jgi:peptidoglycan/LPS O-acetylase OafA/YrhL
LHFAVLHKLPLLLPAIFDVRHVTAWNAILTFVALWAVAVPLTFGLSYLTYSAIEEPMIAAGRRLLASRRLKLAV